MSRLEIEIPDGKRNYLPGDRIAGSVRWSVDDAPRSAELRFYWQTSGKGNRDNGFVRTVTYDNAAREDSREFDFELPLGPYSFSGKLISLSWFLELAVDGEERDFGIVLSPTGEEIRLAAGADGK